MLVTKRYVFSAAISIISLGYYIARHAGNATATYSESYNCASRSTDTLSGRADCAVHELKIQKCKFNPCMMDSLRGSSVKIEKILRRWQGSHAQIEKRKQI